MDLSNICQFCGIVNPEEGLDTQGCCWDDTACKERLKEENTRLREALEKAEHTEECLDQPYYKKCNCFKQALNPEKGEDGNPPA